MNTGDTTLPDPVLAVVEALRFNGRSCERLGTLPEDQWPALLAWCDNRQLTLLLHSLCGAGLPETVRERMSGNRDRYAKRFARLKSDLAQIVEALEQRGIPFVVLKGITHSPAFTPDALLRAQGDIDLWFGAGHVEKAQATLMELGFEPRRGDHGGRRHLPPMARPNGWTWRGDIFDPDMPIHVEVHHSLWSDEAEYISAPGQTDFWNRRTVCHFDGRPLPILSPPDLLGFAALHFLLHLLHGDLPLQRVWEIASFLHGHADDDAFWNRWRQLHPPSLRRLEALVFAIARIWFCCDLHRLAQQEAAALAGDVQLWLHHFALSPLRRYGRPNKDELWLHLALIPSVSGCAHVLLRRMFPLVPARTCRLSRLRFSHHGRTFTPTLLTGLRWLWLKRQWDRNGPLAMSVR